MANQDDGRGLDGMKAHQHKKRRDQRDGDPETGYPLYETGERPPHHQRLRQRIAYQPGHSRADHLDAAELVDKVIEQHRGPYDGQDEQAQAQSLGAPNGHQPFVRAEKE